MNQWVDQYDYVGDIGGLSIGIDIVKDKQSKERAAEEALKIESMGRSIRLRRRSWYERGWIDIVKTNSQRKSCEEALKICNYCFEHGVVIIAVAERLTFSTATRYYL